MATSTNAQLLSMSGPRNLCPNKLVGHPTNKLTQKCLEICWGIEYLVFVSIGGALFLYKG